MRIGIDLGGTKIEVIALSDQGEELFRHRVNTPRDDYAATVQAIVDLVLLAEAQTGQQGTVGIGIPGTISPYTQRVKNANSTWLNGQPLDKDLARALNRDVRIANDANCLAVSEAVDGAGAGQPLVFAVIIGTGSGAGVVSTVNHALAVTVTQASGGTIRCRGWMKTNCVIARKCRATAGCRAVLRRLSPAPASPLIISVSADRR